jgi:hypothetical protein
LDRVVQVIDGRPLRGLRGHVAARRLLWRVSLVAVVVGGGCRRCRVVVRRVDGPLGDDFGRRAQQLPVITSGDEPPVIERELECRVAPRLAVEPHRAKQHAELCLRDARPRCRGRAASLVVVCSGLLPQAVKHGGPYVVEPLKRNDATPAG